MNIQEFQSAIDERIAGYDTLNHPFYQAWSEGKLSPEHLQAYASEYFHLVAAFPTFLSALHCRLEDGALRRAVLRNLAEEEVEGSAHSDMWLDFAQGVGLSREEVQYSRPTPSMKRLIERFYRSACRDSTIEVLAAFYAYQSQVARIAGEKARALLQYYGGDANSCGYFALHSYSDVRHAEVWMEQLVRIVAEDERLVEAALNSAARAALWLWQALDDCVAHRMGEPALFSA